MSARVGRLDIRGGKEEVSERRKKARARARKEHVTCGRGGVAGQGGGASVLLAQVQKFWIELEAELTN